MGSSAMEAGPDSPAAQVPEAVPSSVVIPATVEDYATVNVCAPPSSLPVRLAPGQILYSIDYVQGDERESLGYFVNGHKLHLVCQRGTVPTGEVLRDLVETLFRRHPMATKLIAELVLHDFSDFPGAKVTPAKKTYVLDLPESFDQFRYEFTSRDLRRSLERSERKASSELPGFRFEIIEGAQLTREVLSEAANLIEAHLAQKDPTSDWRAADAMSAYEVYAARGFIARLVSEGRPIAVMLCIRHKQDECYFFAAAYDNRLGKYSLGLICLYRTIEWLIAAGVRRFHMGGGDYGYKSRFGAVTRELYNVEIDRVDVPSLVERVELAITAGARPFWIEKEIRKSLEDLLGERFEPTVGVDFDGVLETHELGIGPQSVRYQASRFVPFAKLFEGIKPTPDDVFVDVGSGKGKALYYAARHGFTKCIGIEVSPRLVQVAASNLRRLGLTADIELLLRDARELSAAEVAAGTVFYLYHPFFEETLRRFLAIVADSQALRPRPITVVYNNARFTAPFEQNGFTLWQEFRTGERLGLPLGTSSGVMSLSFTGTTVAAGRMDGLISVWDVRDPSNPVSFADIGRLGQLEEPFVGHTDEVRSLVASPGGRTLVSAGKDGRVILWDYSGPARARQLGPPLAAHSGPVWAAAYSPNGLTLATAGTDGQVILGRRRPRSPESAHHAHRRGQGPRRGVLARRAHARHGWLRQRGDALGPRPGQPAAGPHPHPGLPLHRRRPDGERVGVLRRPVGGLLRPLRQPADDRVGLTPGCAILSAWTRSC